MDSPSACSARASHSVPATSQSHQRRYILPEIGAFVVFEIDPVASLSEGAQGVPEAIEACKKLANKPYVGVVVRRNGMYLPWEPYNTCLVRFIQQGDPKSVPTKFIEPRMSVPVLPVTTDSHISGRAPIRPSKSLPWNDCHISVSADAFVRSPSTFTDNPADWKLDDEEEDRLQDMMLDDIDEVQAKRYASELEARCQDNQTTFPVTGAADGAIITVLFKHDLSSVEQLNDPLEYFKEVEAIQSVIAANYRSHRQLSANDSGQWRLRHLINFNRTTTSPLLSRQPMNPSTSQYTPLSPPTSNPSQWIHAFVAFTIDPVASLSEGAREIPEAVAACKKLRNKTYVGLIAKWRGLYQPWEPYNTCLLRFLQQGDPVGQPEEFITPAMSVPVLPVTSNAHISGRPPLRPSKLLPWSDCYLSISAGACVRTPSSFTIDPPEWKLDREESLRLHFLCADDIEEMEDRQHAFKTQSSVESVTHEDPVVDAEIDVDEEETSLTELFQDIFSTDDHEKAMITLRFTHDLSLVQELNSPADYLKEVEAIER
ncbi:hypothetical protein R3P38DRAFT_2507057 [Favolaschia claudopus]|uniref:Uncharacterized protein n=1 Tax=Favolaschia claudopus TaxID=2862362 RepID=A0AAW0D8K8_9AGAR